MTVKTILGYEIQPGVSPEEYEQWLFEVHAPDLLANPHLDRIVFNKVLRPVRQASGGSATVPDGLSFYRIAEMHYADEEAYARYLAWFEEGALFVHDFVCRNVGSSMRLNGGQNVFGEFRLNRVMKDNVDSNGATQVL